MYFACNVGIFFFFFFFFFNLPANVVSEEHSSGDALYV